MAREVTNAQGVSVPGLLARDSEFHPALGDRTVREALNRAIDRDEIASILNYPAGLPIVDVPISYEELLRGSAPDPLPTDPDLSRSLLESSGWVDRDDDGVRERNGIPLRFTCLSSDLTNEIAVVLQAQLRRIKVELQIETVAPQLVWRRVENRDYQLAIWFNNFGWMSRFDWISVPSANSFGGYHNPGLEHLLARLGDTMIPSEREGLFEQIWAIWRREFPATVLVNNAHVVVAHRRIRGLSSPYRVFMLTHMDELWIDQGWEGLSR